MKHFLLWLLLLVSSIAIAQTTIIEMPAGFANNNVTSVGCGAAIFTDSGGTTDPYSFNENSQITFCPVIETDRMILDFTFLELGVGDVLTVYDGDSDSAPLLDTFTSGNAAPGPIQATTGNRTGCLTFTFTSNGSNNGAGWEASRSCFDPCQSIATDITTIPAIDADGILRICQGTTVQFDGQAIFSNDGSGATYEWDFDTGNGFVRGQNQSETFTDAGSYQVQFIVTDNAGCTDRDLIDLVIQVSNDPDFSGAVAADQEICLGESTTLTGMVETQEFVVSPAPPVTGTTFLPDGTGAVYQTCIDVEGFDPGATFTDASNLISMFMNVEHTWAGDLDIILTAPNGSSIEILNFGQVGNSKYLGNPNFDDSANAPGIGFEYIIRESPPANVTFQTALFNLPTGSSLPAGDYLPLDPFDNFIGTNLNGRWCLTVTDNLERDNGYIFEWGLNFDPSLLPDDLSFEPNAVREEWLPDPTITARNGNDITVQPTAVGIKCYTYEFEDNFGCVYTKEVCITVNALPDPNPPNDLLVCDNIGNVTTVDLTANTAVMLPGTASNGLDVAYYNSLVNAQNLTSPISNPSQYAAQTAPETIYTSITNRATGCSVVRDFQVSINKAIFNTVPDILTCDDPSNDGFEVFNLENQTAQIIGTQSATEVTVTYHRSAADANADSNPITTPANYTNENSPRQTIFVRVENNSDNTCFDAGSFELIVGGNSVANPVTEFAACDDVSNDGVATFILNTKDAEVLGSQDPAAFEVTYYRSQTEANNRQNPISKTGFQNTLNPQTVVARIDSRLNNACLETVSFELIVNPKPVLGAPSSITRCDDPSGDGMEDFDLSSNDMDILNGLNAVDFEITYHLSQTAADSDMSSIPSIYSSNQPTDDIFVRVENRTTGCFSTTSFQVVINAVPRTVAVPLLESCDANNDGTAVFRLNDRLAAIRDGQNGVDVSYYNSQADALTNASPLNPESYTSSATETIFYRTQFAATGCFTVSDFEIETVAPPVAGIPTIVELCDSGDGTATYNLANSDAQIQNGQANTIVSYFENQAGADNGGSPINKNFVFTANTILYARLENTNTGCFDTIPLELQFGELPQPQLVDEIVLCRDPQGQLVNGPAVLDTGLNNTDFDFEWRFDGQLLPTETDSVLITEQQGSFEVTVFNVITGCQATDATSVRLAGAPDTFTVDVTSQPFDESQRIEITATGPDEYWFQLDDGLYQDSPIFENVTPGIHNITIAERNGCGAVTTQVFIFGYPKFFTPNSDGFNDTWNVDAGNRLPILKIYIFDRYGKLLKELSPTGTGWDGTYLGELLPSSDYWFKLDYEFEGSVGEATGHFSLKR